MAAIRTHVVMPEELVAAVDQLVGPRHRSRFITDAVEERVKRERRVQAAIAVAGSLIDDPDIPDEWRTAEGTSDWVRTIRKEADERVDKLWAED